MAIKRVTKKIKTDFFLIASLILWSVSFPSRADVIVPVPLENKETASFIAKNIPVGKVFDALSEKINKPIVLSKLAMAKRVSGNFNLQHPEEMFKSLARMVALVWYDDGASIYIYDNSEMISQLIPIRYSTWGELITFLKKSGIYDGKFVLRSEINSNVIFVAGPPLYVELIKAAANYLDANQKKYQKNGVTVIPLKNTFVSDRKYSIRGEVVTIPGMETVINNIFKQNPPKGNEALSIAVSNQSNSNENINNLNTENITDVNANNNNNNNKIELPSNYNIPVIEDGDTILSVVGDPGSNSLLVKGSELQTWNVRQLVSALDTAREQIELSLWIIDISKRKLDEIGVRWQAVGKIGGNGIIFNQSTISSSESFAFLSKVDAISRRGDAQIVSRPILLTQENIPALFDNNTSFYTRIEGERVAELKQITYGTMISVVPRIAVRDDVEIDVNIEDGSPQSNNAGQAEVLSGLPIVNRTNISTIARIPKEGSLLIGGYTREQSENTVEAIPVLSSLPLIGNLFKYKSKNGQNVVRIFLIQPRLLNDQESWDTTQLTSDSLLNKRIQGKNNTIKETVELLKNYMVE